MSNNKYRVEIQSSDDDYSGQDCLRRLADVLITLDSGRFALECLKELRDGTDVEDVACRYGRLLPLAAFIERNAVSKFTFAHLNIGGVSC
jgi:hypothetical protein